VKTQNDLSKIKLMIYAIHPVMYQTPIFTELNKYAKKNLPWLKFKVYFGSNLSLKERYFEPFQTSYKSDFNNLLDGYEYEFIRNYAFDEREGFFSRINFGMASKIILGRYDIILLHGYSTLTSLIILFSSILFRKKIIFRGESILRGNEKNASIKNTVKKIYLKSFFYFCHRILYSCAGNKDFFVNYGVSLNKLEFIPCAVNNEFFQDKIKEFSSQKSIIKKDIGIKDEDLVLTMCCSFTKRKRPLDLVNAVKKVKNKNDIFLLFIGDGPERPQLELSLKKTGIRYHITGFLGQNDIPKYYMASDVSLVLSDYDPSPKALNEAMNFSNCIIATRNVGTSSDLIKENVNGYIIETADVDNLSIIIDDLEKNRDKILQMGSESLKIVSDFNYHEDTKAIEKAILDIRNEF